MGNLQELQEKEKKRKVLNLRLKVQPDPESTEFIELQLGTLEQEIEDLEKEIEQDKLKFNKWKTSTITNLK